ncbi:AAA family ATPase [Schaalia vaccimaxillae]|uniref:AAA family ATPase n=1 Tax=Schaalia vaccimaxillae TaxID=183916 RepID=UPI0003B35896|nr:cellulose synthase operon protein YhjQ/BcsQ [Schaalia vaccimaxillae]
MIHNVVILVHPDEEGNLVQALAQTEGLSVVRRCADLAEVRAAARSHVADLAVLDATDPDLDARVIEDLHRARMHVVLVAPLNQLPLLQHLEADGYAAVGAADQVVESLLAIIRSQPSLPQEGPDAFGAEISYPAAADFLPAAAATPAGPPPMPHAGTIIAVWGTSGAPGRSSLAIGLAHALSRYGKSILVDADTANPSIAHMLGLPVDGSSLSALVRQASRANIVPADIDAAAANLSPELSIITGLVTAHRWREVGPHSLVDILRASAQMADWVVVDLASVTLDAVPDDIRHQGSRDDMTAAVLKTADRVLCVVRGDVVGINRLSHVQAWWDELGTGKELQIIVNRLSQAGAGSRPINAIQAALAPILAGQTIHVVPEDEAFTRSLLKAQPITVAEATSAGARALVSITESLCGRQRAGKRSRRQPSRVTH